MANALDFVLGLQKQKQQSELAQAELIKGGFEGVIKNRQNAIANQQAQDLLAIKRESNEINRTTASAKMLTATTQATLLQNFIGGVGDKTDVSVGTGRAKNAPVGSTISVGGVTIPLNPKLTEASISAIAGSNKFEALVARITANVDSGTLNSGLNRSYTQFLAEGGGSPARRFLIKDNTPLEELSSDLAEMKKFAFSEGGKQLSPTELTVVMAGLSVVGKGDKQFKSDLLSAIDILRRKKGLVLGGAQSAQDPTEPDNTSSPVIAQLSPEVAAAELEKRRRARGQ